MNMYDPGCKTKACADAFRLKFRSFYSFYALCLPDEEETQPIMCGMFQSSEDRVVAYSFAEGSFIDYEDCQGDTFACCQQNYAMWSKTQPPQQKRRSEADSNVFHLF